jgi:hypothetical protein
MFSKRVVCSYASVEGHMIANPTIPCAVKASAALAWIKARFGAESELIDLEHPHERLARGGPRCE